MITTVEEDRLDNFLEHYGVKGMRWGVRNDKERPKLTNKQIAQRIAIGAAVVAAVGVSIYAGKQVSNYKKEIGSISNLLNDRDDFSGPIFDSYGSDRGKVFRKGHEFFRSTKSLEPGIKNRTFVTDSTKNAFNFDWYGDNRYKITAIDKVRIASVKQKVDAISDTFDVSISDIAKYSSGNRSLGARIAASRGTKRALGSIELSEVTDKIWKGPKAEKVISVLAAKGYSGTRDDWDGRGATILFENAKVSFEKLSKEQWSKIVGD